MKKFSILLLLLLVTKSIYNFNCIEYNSKIVSYRFIPFYGTFYKILGYKVLSYNCIDIIYFDEYKIRNVSGYMGICNINNINEDIISLEAEE